jgi:hypothetical protein
MRPILGLCEDILSSGAALVLPPLPRMIFVVHGAVSISQRSFGEGEAWHGHGPLTLLAGSPGASIWRWELATAASLQLPQSGVSSREKVAAQLLTMPKGELLLRGDSVSFPPGGFAYLHRHRGPGIRCLIEGGIRIDTQGTSTSYGPGGAWYESGPEAVFAQAALDRPTRFIRVMILPRDLLGKSSIEYVNEEDKGKPRVQEYKILADAPIPAPITWRRGHAGSP